MARCVVALTLSLGLTVVLEGCAGASSAGTQPLPATLPEYDTKWKALITAGGCENTALVPKNGGKGGSITCQSIQGVRHFKFPVGQFDIDEQVAVPANTVIEGNANPNDASDKAKKADPTTQTYFVATRGITNLSAPYCGTNSGMKPGDAQKARIGFLLYSNTLVKNFNFQGRDTVRPTDNGNLCGGGVFETPGCVSPGFGDGAGTGWVAKRTGCYDHTGAPNNLLIGDGKGVENVTIESIRMNDLFLPTDPAQYKDGQGSQLAVWVAMTQDGSVTRNVQVRKVVSMLTRADGINFHGNVQDSVVEDCQIENTGDDGYAFWGAYAENPTRNSFINNVAKNIGVTRNYQYGVCVAVYGAVDLTVNGTKCYDIRSWNPTQPNAACQNGHYCNSCLAYVHDGWFGAVYPGGNRINLVGNKYFYMNEHGKDVYIPTAERPLFRSDPKSAAHIITDERESAVYV